MTKLIWLLLIIGLTGCGSDHTETASTTPAPVVASPSPTPNTNPIIGSWIDSKEKILKINDDQTALSSEQKLHWETHDNAIKFSYDSLEIDSCVYQMKVAGTFAQDFKIVLNLFCDKAGNLTYTKND